MGQSTWALLNGRQRSDKAEKEGSDHDEPPMQMMDVEEEDEDDGRTVTMDKGKLQAIIDRLVQVTKDYPVQEMEEKMHSLLRVVYQHSDEWVKAKALGSVEQHLELYFRPKLNFEPIEEQKSG